VTARRPGVVAAALLAAACSQASSPVEHPAPKTAPRPSGGPAAAPSADPTRTLILYRPSPPARYAFERRDSLTLELPGGATQVQQSSRTAYLTVTIADAPGAYHTTIRLDSLRQDVGGTVAADSVLRAEGTSWTASLTSQGRLTALKADRASAVADQVEVGLPALFPVLPPAGIGEGTQWIDTTERTLKADAFDVRERSVTSYEVQKHDGAVYTIAAATVFQRTGTGGQAAQPMEMASAGTRQAVYRFSRDAGVLEAEGADSAEMTITVPAVGQSVPVHQRASWKAVRR
jgi:hypothetical protein